LSEIRFPAIIVNFKVYREVEGEQALRIALACQSVAEDSGVNIIVCPPMAELSYVARAVKIPVMAQHVDPKQPGSVTGWITPESISASGAIGTLVNHSEHRLDYGDIAVVVSRCKALGISTCVCADTAKTTGKMVLLKPDLVAVEPPELIGGDISVTDARPEVVSDAVAAAKRGGDSSVPVLCGAGIKTGKDVKRALELGAVGVLLASGVVKSKDPKKALQDLVSLI
jgi:triosephosphate isomerase